MSRTDQSAQAVGRHPVFDGEAAQQRDELGVKWREAVDAASTGSSGRSVAEQSRGGNVAAFARGGKARVDPPQAATRIFRSLRR